MKSIPSIHFQVLDGRSGQTAKGQMTRYSINTYMNGNHAIYWKETLQPMQIIINCKKEMTEIGTGDVDFMQFS